MSEIMNNCWRPARQKYGVVVASFSSSTIQQSLSLEFGETVHIREEYWSNEKTVTWLRGCSFNNKSKKGIFPASYVHTKEFTVENEGPCEIVSPVEDAIVKEVSFVLREWNGQWKSLFVYRKSLFHTILLVMGELCKFRATIVSNTLTKEHAEEMKHQAVTMIDWGNGQLGMDLVPRVDYQQADPDSVEEEPDGIVTITEREKHQGEAIHHLLVSLYSFACSVGDNSEVLLSLYDSKDGKFISEKFVMYFTKDGQREGSDKNSSTIFTDLNSEEIRKELFLVVQILRKGRLNTEGGFKKVANFHYRRPWGVSVLCLKDLLQINGEQEYFLRVQCVENESFSNMHESLIKKQIQMVGRVTSTDKQNQGVTLSLNLLHGDMKTIKVENPILFSKGVILTQRMGFSDFINPGEIRNDLYLTLHGAEFDRGSKTASKNVEVRVTVYNDQYELIQDCIFSASGDVMKPNFLSSVLYHNNSPKWNETIRLSIPIEKFSTSHIRLELCHCSNRDKAEKRMFGFAYLSVTTQENTTRLDGKYDLCIYKCEDFAKVKNYLKLPSLRDYFNDTKVNGNNSSNIPYHHSNKEYITVETLLCSSKFAQKAELLSVLQWASNPNLARTIPTSLENLVKLKGQELVRYLQDILDALFNMFTAEEGRTVPFASNIFDTLVFIFNLLHEGMFEKFSIVVEDYLEKSFSSPLAHKEIMHCLKVQAERVYTCTDFDAKSSKRVFKVLEDIFKFSVKSCMLSQRMYGGQSVKEFRDNLNQIFEAFGKVVSSQEKELQKVQVHLLNNLHKMYIPLLFIISNVDLAQLVVFILNKINPEQSGPVTKAKANLIKNTINSQLVWNPMSRSMLLPLILGHLKKCLVMQHHLELTANTLGDLLTIVYKLREISDIKDEVSKIIQGVFDVTVRTLGTLPESGKKNATSLLVACLTEMLRLMDVSHYQKLMNDHPKPHHLRVRLSTVVMPQKPASASKEFLNRVLMVFRNLVRADDLPADWTTMRMVTGSVMLTSIQYISDDLTANFLEGMEFDRELWQNFFLLAVDFITQPALQLERYSEAKSNQIKSKYNDMRVPVGLHICSLWNQLGQNKQNLMLELIGPFLKCTMVPQVELRKVTIPIFFDIMQCEHNFKGHLRRVEGLMIQELDSLVLEHHGDLAYKELFQSILLEKIQSDPELQDDGKRFVTSVTDLLERLLDYREIMDREEQRDTKMHCTFNILNFYKDNRRDMYIRYISRLYELHYSASNFVEAGLTLRLYAQLLSWSQMVQQAEMSYPRQTEAARKEELFSRIMDCFDKGKAWEYGIPLCKELAEHYEKTFQYKNLGQILKKQAFFLSQILEGNNIRQDPTYYRVAYFGNTFPPYLKNKAFIYRGDECLKLATIMTQLMTEYPMATILTTNSPPDESCKLGDAQYIQIVSIKPVPSERPEFSGKEVPSEISSFYNMNEVDTFQFDRPYHRGRKDDNNEFKSLCLERTIMQTGYKLPGILRWYEVINTQIVQLGPVQTATTTVKMMNAELKSSSENANESPEQYLRHLEMRLQGVISGAVNGGIPKYQEAFFNKEYIASYPGEAAYIEILKSVIIEQIHLLDHGLKIHGKFASAEMLPLHRSLVDLFTKTKKSMGYKNSALKHRSSISISSENQSPGTPNSQSANSNGSNRSSIISGRDTSYLDDENIYVEPLECALPTYEHSSSVSVLSEDPGVLNSSLSSSSQPPPIPSRKISTSSGPFSDQRGVSVYRSDSGKSCRSDSQSKYFPPVITTSGGDENDSVQLEPPLLPGKKPSITSVISKGPSTSTPSSITTNSGQFNAIDPGTNSSSMSPYQLKSSEPAATSSDSPPPIVARPPSNRVTIAVPTNTAPSNIVTSPTLHSNRAVPPTPPHTLLLSNKELPDQIPNISPSNTEAPKLPSTRLPSKRVASVLSPTDSSSNRVTPPTLRNTTSPSNKETSNQLPITSPSNTEALKLPSTTSTLKRVTPPPPPPTSQSDTETQNQLASLEVSGDKPPPLVSRSTKKWPPTESETVPASTPTRPTSKGVPPPVPTRKPSITPS